VSFLPAIDRALLAAPRGVRAVVLSATVALMIWTSLPNVPRQWFDYSGVPLLGHIAQEPSYGTDTLSDTYGARVIVHDWRDMYTKARTAQTPQEAATWSREASAPYPPAALLVEAGLYWIGERTGLGFYGGILLAAIAFLASSLAYFVRTRWYLFPLLYLNFGYFSERFVHVQDDTYLIMLVVIMAALWLARAGRAPAAHLLMGLAIAIKLSGLYYVKNVVTMRRPVALGFVAILVAGLVLPSFVWDNYLYIYRYGSELKGHWYDAALALLFLVPFSLVLWYVETRLGFDLEDRIGWGLVPFAMLLAFKMNAPRHLLIVLLVPDKRGLRNVAAAAGLLLPALFPSAVRFGSATPIAAAVIVVGLAGYLGRVGWPAVRADLRHPLATLRTLVA
jgi:hypothetical protein